MHKADPNADAGQASGLGNGALLGKCTVRRESAITDDERCKQQFTVHFTVLEAKYAFLNSQSLEQMVGGDAKSTDDAAVLDYDEFLECVARCARDKYGEMPTEHMGLADGVRGICQNLLGEKTDEAVIRDATYVHAERYDWRLAKPLSGQAERAHRKWLECWQCIEIADLHHFPTWEQAVFELLQECFSDLELVFAHYSKSIGGSGTAEDAVEMTMTEFLKLVSARARRTRDARTPVQSVLSAPLELCCIVCCATGEGRRPRDGAPQVGAGARAASLAASLALRPPSPTLRPPSSPTLCSPSLARRSRTSSRRRTRSTTTRRTRSASWRAARRRHARRAPAPPGRARSSRRCSRSARRPRCVRRSCAPDPTPGPTLTLTRARTLTLAPGRQA